MNLLVAAGNTEENIRQAKNLGAELNLDSIDVANFLISSEQSCGVRISDDDVAGLIHGDFDHYCTYITDRQKK
ncbi:MAG: hypothetical protein J6Y91_05235 [Alphaproteobacteria bacterium]|nr:hypothetical protein [Alphaproteobacteria bacterium]